MFEIYISFKIQISFLIEFCLVAYQHLLQADNGWMTSGSWLKIKNFLCTLHKEANSHLNNQVLQGLNDSSCHFFIRHALSGTMWATWGRVGSLKSRKSYMLQKETKTGVSVLVPSQGGGK